MQRSAAADVRRTRRAGWRRSIWLAWPALLAVCANAPPLPGQAQRGEVYVLTIEVTNR